MKEEIIKKKESLFKNHTLEQLKQMDVRETAKFL